MELESAGPSSTLQSYNTIKKTGPSPRVRGFFRCFLTVATARRGFLATIIIVFYLLTLGPTRRVHVRHVRRRRRPAQVRQVPIITRGEPANFFVYYLTLDGYGADDRWVLLDRAHRLRGALVVWVRVS